MNNIHYLHYLNKVESKNIWLIIYLDVRYSKYSILHLLYHYRK